MQHPKTFFIAPAKGLKIADPETGTYLPETGALMPRSAFWLRRFKDGDVVSVTPAGPDKPGKAKKE